MVAKGSPDVVVFADQISVDDAVAISGHKSTVTRDAREAGHVVHGGAVWCPHDELVGRNLMVARAARAA